MSPIASLLVERPIHALGSASVLGEFPADPPTSFVLDYSTEVLGVAVGSDVGVDETGQRYGANPLCPDLYSRAKKPPAGAFDYNCNGDATESGYALDLDQDGSSETLLGWDDWNNLKVSLVCGLHESGFFGTRPIPGELTDPSDELSADGAAELGIQAVPQFPGLRAEPGCANVKVPEDRDGTFRLALLWSDSFDPTAADPTTIRLAQAEAGAWSDVDANGDGHTDRLFAFDDAALVLGTDADVLYVWGRDADDLPLEGSVPFVWIPSFTDTDSDGVRDVCDSCPTSAATSVPDLDGCP